MITPEGLEKFEARDLNQRIVRDVGDVGRVHIVRFGIAREISQSDAKHGDLLDANIKLGVDRGHFCLNSPTSPTITLTVHPQLTVGPSRLLAQPCRLTREIVEEPKIVGHILQRVLEEGGDV